MNTLTETKPLTAGPTPLRQWDYIWVLGNTVVARVSADCEQCAYNQPHPAGATFYSSIGDGYVTPGGVCFFKRPVDRNQGLKDRSARRIN